MPSLKRSRNERWRLGMEPVMWISLLGEDWADDEFKNLVGLKCCWDSLSECDGDDVLKLKFVLLSGDRCCCWSDFGDWSSRGDAICVFVSLVIYQSVLELTLRLTFGSSSIDNRLTQKNNKRRALIDFSRNHWLKRQCSSWGLCNSTCF